MMKRSNQQEFSCPAVALKIRCQQECFTNWTGQTTSRTHGSTQIRLVTVLGTHPCLGCLGPSTAFHTHCERRPPERSSTPMVCHWVSRQLDQTTQLLLHQLGHILQCRVELSCSALSFLGQRTGWGPKGDRTMVSCTRSRRYPVANHG